MMIHGSCCRAASAAAAAPPSVSSSRRILFGKRDIRQKLNKQKRQPPTEILIDCEALSFLFQDYGNDDEQSSKTTRVQQRVDDEEITTLVGQVSHYFDHVLITSNHHHDGQLQYDDIDVRQLLVACRHYADAMDTIRQRQSARDMRQNIRKVEQSYGGDDDPNVVSSMRALLARELAQQSSLHEYDDDDDAIDDDDQHSLQQQGRRKQQRKRLVKLHEHSCAIGLLWIRRSLEFQYELFHQLVDCNNDAAITAAYDNTLRHYHGWALQKVYAVALAATAGNAMTTTAQLGGFFHNNVSSSPQQHTKGSSSLMTPRQYDTTRHDLQHLMDLWRPLLKVWNDIFDEFNLQDLRRV
jgi:Glycolipid transfer protein (GLTP)